MAGKLPETTRRCLSQKPNLSNNYLLMAVINTEKAKKS